MWTVLSILGVLLILVMAAYAGSLLLALKKQQNTLENARTARATHLKESIVIIAKAMQNGDCNPSEGVIRLKMLLDPLGQQRLDAYPAMFQLYQVVMDMPTHEARRSLKKNERMRLDLTRENAEAELEQQIHPELQQLLADIERY